MLKSFIYRLSVKLPWELNCRFIAHAKCYSKISWESILKLHHKGSITTESSFGLSGSYSTPLLSRFFGTKNFCRTRYQNYGCALIGRPTIIRGLFSRNFSKSQQSTREKNKSTAIYIIAVATVVLGGSYASVPLYRLYCQVII